MDCALFQDPIAKQILPGLVEQLKSSNIPKLEIEVLAPTSTMPLGGNNAACVVCFCTSISQGSSLKNMLDRLLRKTLSAGAIGQPPTQLVGISTVGTERTEKFPYSVQNMMGGKLEKRRQVEEVLISTVRQRATDPPLDYTIIKLGEIKDSQKSFEIRPGDVLDDPTPVETATKVLVQAIAFQPFARNSTFCAAGTLNGEHLKTKNFWEHSFLCLEGPELLRIHDVGSSELYEQLVEYIQGWAAMLAESGKGLTTPVRALKGIESRSRRLVRKQDGVELLFLPTKTGKNYVSRAEEKER